MRTVAAKTQILEDAGYAFSFDRMIHLNRTARKAFSVEFVQDHSDAELEAHIEESPPPRVNGAFISTRSHPME
jgi:hypothetical protein